MKRDEAFPSRFLKAPDLNGEPLILTIAGANYEPLKNHKGNEEQKLVLSFLKTKKLLVVNVTNFDAIVEATGEADSDDWPGHKIEVYPSEVQVGTEMKPCIRVRTAAQGELRPKAAAKPKKPPAKAKAGADDMDDAIPF
jgi:hypothetical protein